MTNKHIGKFSNFQIKNMALDKFQIAQRIARELQDGFMSTWASVFQLWWPTISRKAWMLFFKVKTAYWAWGLSLWKDRKIRI